jgi:hypothetical protein
MGNFLLSIASAETLSWIGFVVLGAALLGEAAVAIIPARWETLHKELAFGFAILAAGGYAVERLGDDTIVHGLDARATKAETEVTRLRAARTLTPERQQFVADAVKPFPGQRYRAAISQAADDGPTFWSSLHAALEKGDWAYLPAGRPSIGIPAAGIPLAAIPGVEILYDPARDQDIGVAALALGKALHANGMVVAVNRETQSNPDPAEQQIIGIRIGARVPPP